MNTNQAFDPKEYVQFDQPSGGGCGMGCWAIGCTAVIALMFVFCGGGFYGLFYSSLPLKFVESAIESEGNVEIEGLKGSLTSGFTADTLRFESVKDKWSELSDIKFKYSGGSSFFRSDSLIIEEISVNGGTIYAEWDEGETELNFELDFDRDMDLGSEFEDLEREFGRSGGPREIRIDLVRVANLKIINTNTGVEITLDDIKFSGFQYLEGELVDLGEFLVKSSQLEMVTVDSTEFAEEEHSKRFEGTVRKGVDHRLTKDLPFAFDFSVNDEFLVDMVSVLADGQVRFQERDDVRSIRFSEFTPGEYIAPRNGQILPSQIDFTLTDSEASDELDRYLLDGEGALSMGKTVFELSQSSEVADTDEELPTRLFGEALVDNKKVALEVIMGSPYSPTWRIALSSGEFESENEVWAQTVFGASFSELNEAQQSSVVASVAASKPPVRKQAAEDTEDESEQSDDADEELGSEETPEASTDADSIGEESVGNQDETSDDVESNDPVTENESESALDENESGLVFSP